jgi:hypothetical protein
VGGHASAREDLEVGGAADILRRQPLAVEHHPSVAHAGPAQEVDGRLHAGFRGAHGARNGGHFIGAFAEPLREQEAVGGVHDDPVTAQAVGDARGKPGGHAHGTNAKFPQHLGDHIGGGRCFLEPLAGELRVMRHREHAMGVRLGARAVDFEVAHHVDAASRRGANEHKRVRTEKAGRIEHVGIRFTRGVE